MRLDEDERDLLRLLEGALRVSEYTDHVDVTSHDYGWNWSFGHSVNKKTSKMETHLDEFMRLLLGLHLCFDFKEGQKRIKKDLQSSKEIFQRIFEGRGVFLVLLFVFFPFSQFSPSNSGPPLQSHEPRSHAHHVWQAHGHSARYGWT